MERIIGINEARPKLTFLIESLADGGNPVILTVNSEPKSVLLNYEEYLRLRKVEKECKRLALKQVLERTRANARGEGIKEQDVLEEVLLARKQKRENNS